MGENNKAIGVFDSGLGGLTVVKEIIKQLPCEDIVYFGDTARVPYGTKSKESIIRFSLEDAGILLKHRVKCIVVACNSSSSYALPTLKRRFKVPIVGVIEPGAKKAVDLSLRNRIGVIATSATVQSKAYDLAVRKNKRGVKIFSQECPLFVPLVEEGWNKKKITRDIISEYLRHLLKNKIDTLILGCTHYPLLKGEIAKHVGKKVRLVDSAKEITGNIKDVLIQKNMINRNKKKGRLTFLVSDKPQSFKKKAKIFLGKNILHVKKVKV